MPSQRAGSREGEAQRGAERSGAPERPLTPTGVTATTGSSLVSQRYHEPVAMTLRLTDEERAALRERASAEGISMQEAARRAVRDYIAHGEHRDRVAGAAGRIIEAHADALDRLGR